MKKYLFISAAALALASCSSDDFLGGALGSQEGNGAIQFGAIRPNMTRGTLGHEASAEKLNNQFTVYGWKSDDDDATNKAKVFDFYKVNFLAGTANSTESNTTDWEYVGPVDDPLYMTAPLFGESVNQSIKYWDYGKPQYDFLAWRIASGDAILSNLNEGLNVAGYKKHALTFQIPTATDLGQIYVADQVTVNAQTATSGHSVHKAQYNNTTVQLLFKNMAAKVRLGIFETVPGYSVKDVVFYTNDGSDVTARTTAETTTTLFAETSAIATSGESTVMFKDVTVAANENQAVAGVNISESDYNATFGILNANTYVGKEYKETDSKQYIGRASNQATMSTGDVDGWTYVFPMPATELTLKVDYTLVSKDGSGETIQVTGATAKVPANYCNWLMNYAYTYLFKISDNTNGSTGDPDSDPAGLYPITFDALVVNVDEGNTQETITTISEPSITTYQNGSAVTTNNEYVVNGAKEIFITVEDAVVGSAAAENGLAALSSSNSHLYLVNNYGNEPTTEEVVANYKNNKIVLTDISDVLSYTKTIPADQTIDNVAKDFATTNNVLAKFTPLAGYTYVYEYTDGSSVEHYKVIKMNGTPTAPVFAFGAQAPTGNIEEGGSATIPVTATYNAVSTYKVYGAARAIDDNAANKVEITETATAGTYQIEVPDGATQGTHQLSLGSATKDISVDVYSFSAAVTMAAGETVDNAITLQLNGSNVATSEVGYNNSNFEITPATGVSLSANGSTNGYKLTSTDAAAGEYKLVYKGTNGDVVAEQTITVQTYAIAPEYSVVNLGGITADKSVTINVKLGGADKDGVTPTSSNTSLATIGGTTDASGNTTLTGKAVGDVNVTMPGASATVYVKNFTAKLYNGNDPHCSGSEVSASLNPANTYYLKFADNGTAKNESIKATNCTLSKSADAGVYKVSGLSAGQNVTIKYTYMGREFTLIDGHVVE